MARTEIHPISSTLNIAIDYIIDPEKTDGQKLCSTYECTLQCAAMDFEDVHMQGTGRTTVLAQHMIQSFKPGEVSPDEAHKNQKTHRTNIIDIGADRIKSSKGLERWATIHNMQVASQMINILTEKGFSSPDEIDDKLMQLHEDKLRLAERLNDLQDAINNASELVTLLETYRKFKPVYSQYKDVRNKEKFRKEHSSEISKYESVVRQLKEQFPDNKIPQLESERNKMDSLISERDKLNSRYKEIKTTIEETELAKRSVEEYLNGQNRDEIGL